MGPIVDGIYNLTRIGIIGTMLALAACGDLTQSDVEQILGGEERGAACQSELKFTKGGFNLAKTNGALTVVGRLGFMTDILKVADAPGGDQWMAKCAFGSCINYVIRRKSGSKQCLRGYVEVESIADAPFAAGSGSYKMVNFTEVVILPKELKHIKDFIFTRYRKSLIFQKTDRGWRVMR